jgi:high-affinity nickel permease
MAVSFSRFFHGAPLKRRILILLAALVLANLAAWAWALGALGAQPLLLGTAALAWSLGLRHGVDADHIAAIDNVTRKLMQQGQRPIAVGFWFALGHSGIIAALSVAVALTANALSRFEAFREVGGVLATGISAFFLFAIAGLNLAILRSVWQAFRRARAGLPHDEESLDMLLASRGGWRGCCARCSALSARAGTWPCSASCSGWASTRPPKLPFWGSRPIRAPIIWRWERCWSCLPCLPQAWRWSIRSTG